MAKPIVVWARPSGLELIAIWSGAIADIPSGWRLCDGTNNTPDLRNRFVMSVQPSQEGLSSGDSTPYSAGSHAHTIAEPFLPPEQQTDAEDTHTHSADSKISGHPDASGGTTVSPAAGMGDHTHDYTVVTYPRAHGHDVLGSSTTAALTVDPKPPYYALAYIKGSALPDVGAIVMYDGPSASLMGFTAGPWATLGADLNSGDTMLTTTGAPSIIPSVGPLPLRVYVENEIIGVEDIGSGPTLWGVTKGLDGTSDDSHSSGAVMRLPGFDLCDGASGTPNLHNRFLAGAGNLYTNLQNLGGGASIGLAGHTHDAGGATVDGTAHTHQAGDSQSSHYATLGGPYAYLLPAGGSLTGPGHWHYFNASTALTPDGTHTHGLTVFQLPAGATAGIGYALPAYYTLVFLKRVA